MLGWAQGKAGDAIDMWETARVRTVESLAPKPRSNQFYGSNVTIEPPPADAGASLRAEAIALLTYARQEVSSAGAQAADTIRAAADIAPPAPDPWQVASAMTQMVVQLAITTQVDTLTNLVNGTASVANALIEHPETILEILGGIGLMAAGARWPLGATGRRHRCGNCPRRGGRWSGHHRGCRRRGRYRHGNHERRPARNRRQRGSPVTWTRREGSLYIRSRGEALGRQGEAGNRRGSGGVRRRSQNGANRRPYRGLGPHQILRRLLQKRRWNVHSNRGEERRRATRTAGQREFDGLVSEANPAIVKVDGEIIRVTSVYLKRVP